MLLVGLRVLGWLQPLVVGQLLGLVVRGGRIHEFRDIRGEQPGDAYILPGFIDAPVHIESSMLVPTEFARMAVVHGTVATVSDPHEIANVLGAEGVWYMVKNAANSPLKFHFGAPSCVPATPFDKAGGDQTMQTRVFDIVRGAPWPSIYPGRALRNSFSAEWHGREDELAATQAEAEKAYLATAADDFSKRVVWAGEGVDLVNDIPSLGEETQ